MTMQSPLVMNPSILDSAVPSKLLLKMDAAVMAMTLVTQVRGKAARHLRTKDRAAVSISTKTGRAKAPARLANRFTVVSVRGDRKTITAVTNQRTPAITNKTALMSGTRLLSESDIKFSPVSN
jgi:hypothetical protein